MDEISIDASEAPLQIVCVAFEIAAAGVGSTVTSKLNDGPGQFVVAGPTGEIMYLTTPEEVPELINV
jgi:hypothetical protein